jgi:hypothetical protein
MNMVSNPLRRYQEMRRFSQVQFAVLILHDHLPDGHGTQKQLMFRIDAAIPDLDRKALRLSDQP